MAMNNAFNFAKGVAEFFTPVLTSSHFTEKGVLTPEEYVAAGDLLVFKCPTWSWQAGNPDKKRPFLPDDKQFLITRNVPSLKRVTALEVGLGDDEVVEGDDGEDWLATANNAETSAEDVGEIGMGDIGSALPEIGAGPVVEEDLDDIPDIDDFEDDNLLDDSVAPLDASTAATGLLSVEEPVDNIMKTRTYDITITYDKFYQTPRIWLVGYDEQHQPLKPERVFDDVIQDYAKKTVTIESHPHLDVACASIHPCKHSVTMKKIIDHLALSGRLSRVDQYLFLFLKFISSVVPTIEYDNTMEMEAATS